MPELGPYRDAPGGERCPRCDDTLERALEGVSTCLRCGGVWVAVATIAAAFGDPGWPVGTSLWWRNELACPTCAIAGGETIMTVVDVGGAQIDRCPSHGVWLDRGELGRVMGGTAGPLDELRDRLTGLERALAEPRPSRQPLTDARGRAAAEVDRLEADSAAAAARLRRIDGDLAAARARLRAIDDELERS